MYQYLYTLPSEFLFQCKTIQTKANIIIMIQIRKAKTRNSKRKRTEEEEELKLERNWIGRLMEIRWGFLGLIMRERHRGALIEANSILLFNSLWFFTNNDLLMERFGNKSTIDQSGRKWAYPFSFLFMPNVFPSKNIFRAGGQENILWGLLGSLSSLGDSTVHKKRGV